MPGVMPRLPPAPMARAPPSFHDLVLVVGKGSLPTSVQELSPQPVGVFLGYALQALARVLQALLEGARSRLLMAVLHLCLAKPAWLVRSNRPNILEPYQCRLETGVVQERRMSRKERRGAVATELFVYRRQLSAPMLALACRWLLAGWVQQHGTIWSDD